MKVRTTAKEKLHFRGGQIEKMRLEIRLTRKHHILVRLVNLFLPEILTLKNRKKNLFDMFLVFLAGWSIK